VSISTLDFVSKDCKQDNHQRCGSKWSGFGFDVVCRCPCHSIQKLEALDVAPNSATNALIQSPEEELPFR
jgi:hypothetical protein